MLGDKPARFRSVVRASTKGPVTLLAHSMPCPVALLFVFAACATAVPADAASPGIGTSDVDAIAELRAQVIALSDQVRGLQARLDAKTSAVADAAPTSVRSVMPSDVEVMTVANELPPALTAAGPTGPKVTPGGFLEFAGVYRQHFQGNDLPSSFGSIPFPANRIGHAPEAHFSARQSRISLLIAGTASPGLTLGAFADFDLLGAAQTANSIESNSYNPRLRNGYATIDWAGKRAGLHVLLGQSWSLVTMDAMGIQPRGELLPPLIESQLMPGVVWTRQPQLRLSADMFDRRLWIAFSAENPQSSFGGTIPAGVTAAAPGGAGFNGANSVSLGHIPDLVGKAAYEANVGRHHLHVEAELLHRNFEARLSSGETVTRASLAVGGGVALQILPGRLDVEISAMTGRGIGRYGSALFPDATFTSDGRIEPLLETALLAGGIVHATSALDVYGFAGEERVEREATSNVRSILYGYGNALADDSGCLVEGGTCLGNTKSVRQMTIGAWQKLYRGPLGRAQVGLQYSYTVRSLFAGLGGAYRASQTMGFFSFRYYPF